jgi:hypothetical protein
MRITATLMLVGMLVAPGILAATHGENGATISATSLFTAERRAREAAERLRMPAESPARWKAGGRGWTPAWTAEPRPPRKACD